MAADRVNEIGKGLPPGESEKAVPVIRHDHERMEKHKPQVACVEEGVDDILTLTRMQRR